MNVPIDISVKTRRNQAAINTPYLVLQLWRSEPRPPLHTERVYFMQLSAAAIDGACAGLPACP